MKNEELLCRCATNFQMIGAADTTTLHASFFTLHYPSPPPHPDKVATGSPFLPLSQKRRFFLTHFCPPKSAHESKRTVPIDSGTLSPKKVGAIFAESPAFSSDVGEGRARFFLRFDAFSPLFPFFRGKSRLSRRKTRNFFKYDAKIRDNGPTKECPL